MILTVERIRIYKMMSQTVEVLNKMNVLNEIKGDCIV